MGQNYCQFKPLSSRTRGSKLPQRDLVDTDLESSSPNVKADLSPHPSPSQYNSKEISSNSGEIDNDDNPSDLVFDQQNHNDSILKESAQLKLQSALNKQFLGPDSEISGGAGVSPLPFEKAGVYKEDRDNEIFEH